ncbi:hypothetical protein KAR91_37745 [Candidatus Pacearchaeota archaeon]|nr:hypothetical protein [Candidatus Pacearchaeota archaeon]
MIATRELYHQIENIEALSTARDMTNQEFDRISKLQDAIADIEHLGYELKSEFESVNHPNDHLVVTVFSKEDGCPVDSFKVYCEGNRYMVRGQWKSCQEAEEWAKQVLSKWFG